MNLLQVRKKFVQDSGRYDLIVDTTDWVDNGADFYINSAIKMLNRLVELPETKGKLFYSISAGEYSQTFQHSCRIITTCWINDTANRWPMEKVDYDEFKEYYNELASATTQGRPKYFTLAHLRALETTDQTSGFMDINHLEDDTKYDYRGILFGPPADGDYVIEVDGFFKNATLSNDSDENYWTLEEDDLLLRTSLYKLEAFSRGTENARNYLSAILDDVKQIDFDIAAEESFGINQIEG